MNKKRFPLIYHLHRYYIVFEKIQMWKFTMELLSYSYFVCILYVISYSNGSSDDDHQVIHLCRLFLNSGNFTHDFSRVSIIVFFFRLI